MVRPISLLLPLLLSCATAAPTPDAVTAPTSALPEETHLKDLAQLTFGGENAEAYWSFDGQGVSLQRRVGDQQCDRIYTMPLFAGGQRLAHPQPTLLSSGKGATTCAHYLPGGDEVLYASTHLGGEECPPRPDMSLGYVWALYDSYDIFKVKADGTGLTRLTDVKGYDAEGTVCAKDGSIVFTSDRDGDIELYRMDRDGKNVKRLTFEPGYDGGAFFNADCSKLVWRASRPKPGKELEDFKALLAKGLVRPTQLELYVANADGSDAHQVTYLKAASFAPFWFPHRERIIFASNHGDPKGREFDLWAVNADGTDLERITFAKGFDGFPMFSPDGKWLMFSSNRATPEGKSDTNLFLARWDDAAPKPGGGAAERIRDDVRWLADPAREGRGIGTQGLEAAGAYLEERFRALGLEPLGDAGGYRAAFQVRTKAATTPETQLTLAGAKVPAEDFLPLGWSGTGAAKGQAVLVGYGLEDQELGFDDWKGLDVKGKVAVALRFTPESEKLATPAAQRRAGDLRKKAFLARAKGAKALLVVDWPMKTIPPGKDEKLPAEAPLPALRPESAGDAGLPVVVVKRAALEKLMPLLLAKKKVEVALLVALTFEKSPAFNVVARLAGAEATLPPLFVGAHYDHLGFGGPDSLAPDKHEAHLGADDNASGTAVLLELARALAAQRDRLSRDVVVAAFSGEEAGVLGSAALVQSKPTWLEGAVAMLNFDMVGRLRMNSLNVLGVESATEWKALVEDACLAARVQCKESGDGYGPSDQTPFYAAGLPVLHFFTGAHSEYHKPTDAPATINAIGAAGVAQVAAAVVTAAQSAKLSYQKVSAPAGKGDARSFGASLGTVPDYGGPPGGVGVLLSDVRPGGGADKAGMHRGDVILKLGKFDVRSVEDLMFVLMQARPGETVKAEVLREGKSVELQATFQEGRRR